jgi:hypothetical protein
MPEDSSNKPEIGEIEKSYDMEKEKIRAADEPLRTDSRAKGNKGSCSAIVCMEEYVRDYCKVRIRFVFL